jgi:RNA polymerase sigma factor (sigma-70 family)
MMAKRATSDISDQQLLETFLNQRSEASFIALMQRHGTMVFGVCRRLLRNTQDAEDAFQSTFLILARQAASIRRKGSVGSWLYGVAFRIAEKMKRAAARRAAHECRCSVPLPGDALDDISWREIRSALDEELQSLPERYRAPLVLCYLEAQTQDEAARHLGWSKNTFGRRMKRARELLAQRLKRRGITLSAALTAPLLIDNTATATVPPLLAASTVRAGLAFAMGQSTGTLVSSHVSALVESGMSGMLAKKTSIVIVVLVSLLLGLGGFAAHRAAHSRTLAEAPSLPPARTPPALPTRSESKERAIDIKGRVLDPDGKSLAGAKVYLSTYSYKDKSDPKIRFETAEDGRFHFLARPLEVEDRETMVAAVAPGYGPDWTPLKENGELTLRLAKDDVPIKGRVLDLEGRPIAGVSVRMVRLWKMPSEAVTAAIKQLQANPKEGYGFSKLRNEYEQSLSSVWGVLTMPKAAKSGADGRFQLGGFGRDRIVELRIEGPRIEYRTVTVILRAGLVKGLPLDVHGPTFDHLAAPSKPIRGIVREKANGKPLAGIRVGCQAASGEWGSEAFTDKQGHYEIPGIRKSDKYILNVGYRNPPYINYSKEVGDTPILEPVTADLEMERALVLRIRVTEKGTGKPVHGMVEYDVSADNPNLSRFTTFPHNTRSADVNKKDGSYEQTVLPGPGYIAFRATKGTYLRSRLKGEEEHDRLLGGIVPGALMLGFYHAVVPINPSAKDAQSLVCDIVLDRGRTLSGVVADPEGRPLSGTLAWGIDALMSLKEKSEDGVRLAASNFTATGLNPRYPRTLIFYHREKKLAKALLVRGDEKGPLTVRLQPLGALTGRVVDAAGKPKPGISVALRFEPKQLLTFPEEHIFGIFFQVLGTKDAITDKDGRFRIEGLVEGLKYDLNLGSGKSFIRRARKELAGKPGAVVDVGEIKMEAQSPQKPSL